MKHGVKPEADLLNSCNRTLESDLDVRTVEYLFIFTVASYKLDNRAKARNRKQGTPSLHGLQRAGTLRAATRARPRRSRQETAGEVDANGLTSGGECGQPVAADSA